MDKFYFQLRRVKMRVVGWLLARLLHMQLCTSNYTRLMATAILHAVQYCIGLRCTVLQRYALHQLRSQCSRVPSRQVDRKAMLTTPSALVPILGITVRML